MSTARLSGHGWGQPGGDHATTATDALLASMVANSPVGLAMVDRDLRFLSVNTALAAMNGIPAEDHLGRTPMELLPGLPPESYLPDLRDVLDGKVEVHHVLFSGETPAEPGVLRHWEESLYAVRGASGEIEGLGWLPSR